MKKTISITSGKGGVGKSLISVNLALALESRLGKTLLYDADFGMANTHLLLNFQPTLNLLDILEEDKKIREIIGITDYGISIVPGAFGAGEMLNLEKEKLYKLIRSTEEIVNEFDYMVIDTAAGADDVTLECLAASDTVIVVLQGLPTSFLDSYSLIKAAHLDYKIDAFQVVVNMVNNDGSAYSIYNKFLKTVTRFLDIELNYLGYIPESKLIKSSITRSEPIYCNSGLNEIQDKFDSIATKVSELKNSVYSKTRFYN